MELGRRAVAEWPELPVFLLGHSMGGLITTHTAAKIQGLRGAVLSCPALLPDPAAAPPMLIKIGRVLSKVHTAGWMVAIQVSVWY